MFSTVDKMNKLINKSFSLLNCKINLQLRTSQIKRTKFEILQRNSLWIRTMKSSNIIYCFICLFTFFRWSFSCDPGANKWRPKVQLHQGQLHSSTYTHIPIAFKISTQLQNIMISFEFNQKFKLACVLNPMHASWEEFPNLCEIKPKQKTYK